jgi:NADPH-dependent 2,4-dienoyl-CoA reductase/sulfur reductase-like enzyme
VRVEHWVVAQRQGQHAALAMLGKPVRYAEIPFFWTVQFEQAIKYVGYVPKPDQVVHLGDVEGGEFLAAYFAGGRLAAAVGVGHAQDLVRIHNHLTRGVHIGPADFERAQFANP